MSIYNQRMICALDDHGGNAEVLNLLGRIRKYADELPTTQWHSIFKIVGSDDFDTKQKQAHVDPRATQDLQRLNRIVNSAVGHYTNGDHVVSSKASFLLSEKGGKQQELHADHLPIGKKKNMTPAVCVVSLQSGTRMVFDDGEVIIPLGCCLIFGGTTYHGGASYKSKNIRLHFFLRPKNMISDDEIREDETVKTYVCNFCYTRRFHNKWTLKTHKSYYCHANPNAKDKKARRNKKKRKRERALRQLELLKKRQQRMLNDDQVE